MSRKNVILSLVIGLFGLFMAGLLMVSPVKAQLGTTITFDPNSTSLVAGNSVVGSEVLLPGLVIANSAGNDIIYIKEGQNPAAFSGYDYINPAVNDPNGCIENKWGISDAAPNIANESRKHQYEFTFTDSQTVGYFSLRVEDWGDFLPFGACPNNTCSLHLTGYDATNTIIDTDSWSFTASASGLSRPSVEFGHTRLAGDACTEITNLGNAQFELDTPGIARVTLAFANQQSMDPNIALTDITYAFDVQTPDPSPSVTPSPTPTTQTGARSALGTNVGSCNATEFEATFDLTDNGQAKEGVQVTFTYNGSTKTATTNTSGRAQVFFTKNGEGNVVASANGYPTQTEFRTFPTDCPANNTGSDQGGSVLGAHTENTNRAKAAQVLGATTLANTGAQEEKLAMTIALAGLALMSTSVSLLIKKK